jgi:cell wall-associated NlpC family hydrolase
MQTCKKFISIVLTVLTLCSLLSVTVSATNHTIKTGVGVVDVATGSNLRLRESASTSSANLAYAPDGEVVIVEGKVGDWYKVIYNLKEGYMHSDYLDVTKVENVELGYGVVNDTRVNIRSGPGTKYASLGKFTPGDKAYIIGINNQWYKVIYNGQICYIRSDYLDVTEIPYENQASAKKPIFFVDGKSTGVKVSADALNSNTTPPAQPDHNTPSAPSVPDVPASELAESIIAMGKKYIGVPYKWAGATPSGFDCSGFVMYVFGAHGITLPHNSRSMYSHGTSVAKKDLRPGDLVFFYGSNKSVINHVGIYIGNGQFIHSSSSKGITITGLESSYYVNHYYGAKRIL